MPINVNCTSFQSGGGCLHQAAPRRWFGAARCIVWLDACSTAPKDPRVAPADTRCVLCTPIPRPTLKPFIPQAGHRWVEGAQ